MTIAKNPKLRVTLKKELNVEPMNTVKLDVNFDSKNVCDFLESAPDGKKGKSRWKLKGKKVIITHSIYPEELEKLDAMAESMGVKRAQLINMMIQRELSRFNNNPNSFY